MVTKFLRPRDAAEAATMLRDTPGAQALAGGTYLLTSEFRGANFAAVSVAGILPAGIDLREGRAEIGANATFQDLLNSPAAPRLLREAARGMGDRNIRNRATVGGNLGANKSCASLVPAFIALGAVLELADGRRVDAEAWLAEANGSDRGIIVKAIVPAEPGRCSAYARMTRTSCDISTLTCAVSFMLKAGALSGLKIALGGLGPRSRRFPELEALFEGKPLPAREAIEAAAMPLLDPRPDLRGGTDYKRLRAAQILADALIGAASDESAEARA